MSRQPSPYLSGQYGRGEGSAYGYRGTDSPHSNFNAGRTPSSGAPGAPKSDPIMDIINQRTAQQQQFYQGQIGQALRGISAQYSPQRSAMLQALEARGMGRSSEVGRGLGALAGQEGMRGQEAISDIGAQAFTAQQQMWNMYLNYMFQKKLQKDAKGSGGVFDLIGDIGGGVFDLIDGGGGGGGSSQPYYPGGQSGGGYG